MKRIALYGGAFSPPHKGHASVIRAILEFFPCDEIWVMPSADRHDKKITASGEHRLKMLKIMIDDLFPQTKVPIIISDFEVTSDKQTVTHETLVTLKGKFPDHEFSFIIGSENLPDIQNKWIRGKELLRDFKLIAIKKPGAVVPENISGNIFFIDLDWFSTSSTIIRKIISEGGSPNSLISNGVLEYIKTHDLYK